MVIPRKKAARGRGRGRRVARDDGGKNGSDEIGQSEPSTADSDPAPDALGDPASPDGDAALRVSESAGRPKRKKAAKKPTKKPANSDNDGSDGAKDIKADAKKPARGRRPKVKSQTDADGTASNYAGSGTIAKKPARKSPVKKAKKLASRNAEDASASLANGSADANSQTANRAPISSAPQNVIDVGSAAPDARKRGWWSRGE